MSRWTDLPRDRLLADVSLWSADLANLAADVTRLSPFADSFHLDVCDAHFAPGLLFFPDLVRALRPHTATPFHVHLFVERPVDIIPDFLQAGADLITVHAETPQAGEAIRALRQSRCAAGLALMRATPVQAILPYLDTVETVLLLGTEVGVKGQDLAPDACDRLAEAGRLISSAGAPVRLIADGGIRPHTVPLLRSAGADAVVPGSLVFNSQDLPATFDWLHRLPGART